MRLVADLNEGKPEPRVAVMDSSVRVMLTQRSQLPAPFASTASTLCLATLATASTHARNCQHPLPRQGGGEKGSGGTSECPLHLGLKAPDDSNRREKGGRTERRKQRERERGMESDIANLRLRPMPDPFWSPKDLGPAWLLVANVAANDVAGASEAPVESCLLF